MEDCNRLFDGPARVASWQQEWAQMRRLYWKKAEMGKSFA